jgi:hypothetical protein
MLVSMGSLACAAKLVLVSLVRLASRHVCTCAYAPPLTSHAQAIDIDIALVRLLASQSHLGVRMWSTIVWLWACGLRLLWACGLRVLPSSPRPPAATMELISSDVTWADQICVSKVST